MHVPSINRNSRTSGRSFSGNSSWTQWRIDSVSVSQSGASEYTAQSRPCAIRQSFSPRFTKKDSRSIFVPPCTNGLLRSGSGVFRALLESSRMRPSPYRLPLLVLSTVGAQSLNRGNKRFRFAPHTLAGTIPNACSSVQGSLVNWKRKDMRWQGCFWCWKESTAPASRRR